jgi:drug/metabolite transporter (DMT)-like permease
LLSSSTKSDLLLILVTLLAAIGWIFSKESLMGVPPLLFIALRFFGAGVILASFGIRPLLALDKQGFLRTLGVGVTFGVAMCFWILGLNYATHIGVGAFLTSLGVVLVPIVAIAFGEKPTASTWAALPVAAIGLACLSLDSQFHMGFGEVSFLIAAVLFAFMFNLNTRAAAKTSTIALSAIQLMVVGVVALPVSLAIEDWEQISTSVDIWAWVIASIVIATSLRFFIQTWAQSLASASNAAVIMTLEPVWTAILAAFWFHETMSGLQLWGCAFIFGALIVGRWRSVRMMLRALLSQKKPAIDHNNSLN